LNKRKKKTQEQEWRDDPWVVIGYAMVTFLMTRIVMDLILEIVPIIANPSALYSAIPFIATFVAVIIFKRLRTS